MFYVPDGTKVCGFYQCKECGSRFLSVQVAPRIICSFCGEDPDMEIGPDDEMPKPQETAELLQVIEGEEEVEKMDGKLSLAITGGDYGWI